MSGNGNAVEALETKISYLEKTVADLDGLVLDYGRRTERLEQAMKSIVSRLSDMGNDKGTAMPAGERPPHY